MKKKKNSTIKIMKHIILYSIILFSLNCFSVIGQDDRFYIHGTQWGKLLNGIVQFIMDNGTCTAFVIEGDIIVSAAHCFSDFVKSGKIDYKKLKKDTYFLYGDMNIDPLDDEDSHFNHSFKLPKIKDLFLAYDPSLEHQLSSRLAEGIRDYAFIKLKKPIPKHIKRFKIFHPDLLKDYEILKHSYRGNLSTAGYHGDNDKTIFQRMAHIGCKVRDRDQHQKIWFEYVDCDAISGSSGAPIFYILRHKKTKKIELAVRNILVFGTLWSYERMADQKNKDEKASNPTYRLGKGVHYFRATGFRMESVDNAEKGILITNYKEFLSNLEKFKKDPSFFRNKKIPELEKTKYLNKKWIYENIVQKKSLKELKEFFDKDLPFLSRYNERSSRFNMENILIHIAYDSKFQMSASKRNFLQNPEYFFGSKKLDHSIVLSKKTSKLYPSQKRAKQFSYQKLFDPLRKTPPLESSINDKEKAKKLWKMYFLTDQKKDKLSNDQIKAKKRKELYFFK